jgi:hypothetical protein
MLLIRADEVIGAISINTVATAVQAMTSAILTNTLICINAQNAQWEFN